MYISTFNQLKDKEQILSFMRKYSFGTIITAENNIPFATHLPFLIDERDEKLIILSHLAKANPQASALVNNEVLVIFSEPHAYISPRNYEKETNVPTWNYIAIHAYGKARLLETEQEHMDLLERTINYYEADYLKQWQSLPAEYKSRMIRGITGFEITVSDLQAKSKLSQNRTEIERENIINDLGKSHNTQESDIAEYMRGLKKD